MASIYTPNHRRYALLCSRSYPSTVHNPEDNIKLIWTGLKIQTGSDDGDLTIGCHGYSYPDNDRFMYACYHRRAKYISFAANRMSILELIPFHIIQGQRAPQFKIREMQEPHLFTLFPHNYPHQMPIILARRWVIDHCDLALLAATQNNHTSPLLGLISSTLPDSINGVTENVASALECISYDTMVSLAIISAPWRDPISRVEKSLTQDEYDVAIAILSYLGVEIA